TAGVTRAWTDANRNLVPDCDLLNPAAQDLRASGGGGCGVMSNTPFGRNQGTNKFEPANLDGRGGRPSGWALVGDVQQQLGRRASVEARYVRRWFNGFFGADNLALQLSDLTPFGIVAPGDPRLPQGGGYVVGNLFDVVPDKTGQVNNFVTSTAQFGD